MDGGVVRILSGKFCPPKYKVDLPFLLSASSLRRFDGPTEPEIMGTRLGLDIVCVFTSVSHRAAPTCTCCGQSRQSVPNFDDGKNRMGISQKCN